MSEEDKVRFAKNLAARKAFEVYAQTLQEVLKEQGVKKPQLGGTEHVHDAVLLDESGNGVYIKCTWHFNSHPAVVNAAIARAKSEGQA